MTNRTISSFAVVLASAFAAAPGFAQTPSLAAGATAPAATATTPDSASKQPAAKQDSTPKPEFKPSWNFSAWIFGAYNYQTDSTTKAVNNGNPTSKFTVDRAYLTFRGMVAPDWGFRVTTDVVTLGSGAGYSGLTIRLKYAWMQWDFAHAADPNDMSGFARIGQITTVAIDNEERFWPRWIQKTGLEYWAIQPSSADLGAGAQLNLPGKWGNAYFVLDNGTGYSVANDADRYKDAALRLSLTPMGKSTGLWKTLELNGWYQVGRSQNTFATGPGAYKAGLENNSYGVFLGNADPRFQFGFDYAERITQSVKASDSSIVDNTAKLTDGFVVVRPFLFNDPKGTPLGVILRYDTYQGNTNVSTKNHLFIATLFYDVAKSSSLGISYQGQTQASPSSPLADKTIWQLNYQITF
ncbi:MAG TPA: hypothetical protein VMT93_06555 [Gemmatimonadaceae bacterium]|nr:hypothetical protein [Gemmatimonadaceae bacterium]